MSKFCGRLPDFIIIGAGKAGTTSLDFYLGLHPEIHMAQPKEPRFFVDAPEPAGRWCLGVEWYKKQFKTSKRFCGEASPQYSRAPSVAGVPERMARTVPQAKLIYLVREPMARLRSNYLMNAKHGVFSGSFAEYVEKRHVAFDSSCYGRQLQEYLRYYALENILILESLELQSDRARALRKIFRFIGADDTFFSPLIFHKRHVGGAEFFPSPLGTKILGSVPMKFAQRHLHGGIFYYLRNLVLWQFRQPLPSTELPETKEHELRDFFHEQVALLTRLSGQSFPSLQPASTHVRL